MSLEKSLRLSKNLIDPLRLYDSLCFFFFAHGLARCAPGHPFDSPAAPMIVPPEMDSPGAQFFVEPEEELLMF